MDIINSVNTAPINSSNQARQSSEPVARENPRRDLSNQDNVQRAEANTETDRVTLSAEARALAETQEVERNRNDGQTRPNDAVENGNESRDRRSNSDQSNNAVATFENVAQSPRSNNFHAVA